MKSRRSRACQISGKVRNEVKERDGGCIFCRKGILLPEGYEFGMQVPEIMHFRSRARGGLGIAENLALGCRYHHELLDSGAHGERDVLLPVFEAYLREQYPEWDSVEKEYRKWA